MILKSVSCFLDGFVQAIVSQDHMCCSSVI